MEDFTDKLDILQTKLIDKLEENTTNVDDFNCTWSWNLPYQMIMALRLSIRTPTNNYA